MNLTPVRLLVAMLCAAQLSFVMAAPDAQGSTALVFGGDGTENDDPTGTLRAAVLAAQSAGFDTKVVRGPLSEDEWREASVWIQPGGENFDQAADMQRTGLFDQVRKFVEAGGGYVGFCAGAFMAQSYGSYGLGLLPGMAIREGERTHKTQVVWNGRTRYVHYEYGPKLERVPGVEVFATYVYSGAPAAVRGTYGQGRVVVSGVHPEALPDWLPEYDPDGPDTDLAIDMIREAARD